MRLYAKRLHKPAANSWQNSPDCKVCVSPYMLDADSQISRSAMTDNTISKWHQEANMSTWLAERKNSLIEKYRSVIREKAIAQAKVEIAMAGKYVTDYDQEQLEVIVKAQEDKIVQKYRNSTFVVLLLVLGIA
jgi:hypothetical protein